jgi:hypothetical protein
MIETNKGVSLVVMILSVIVVMIIGFFAYQQFFSHGGSKENINFSKTGNLVINNPGMESDVWYLIYEIPGSPAIPAKLSFDAKSVCKNQSNSCLDLIVGERVSIKGIEEGGEITVREMDFLDSSEVNVSGPTGIDWDMAIGFLNNCEVVKVFANHKKEVYLTLKDGREMFTVESDDVSVSAKIKEAEKVCGKIPFATE